MVVTVKRSHSSLQQVDLIAEAMRQQCQRLWTPEPLSVCEFVTEREREREWGGMHVLVCHDMRRIMMEIFVMLNCERDKMCVRGH